MTENETERADPNVDTVKTTVAASRDDVPDEELHGRAESAVQDLEGGSITAFTVPLAVNRVRTEVNTEHGLPEKGSADPVDEGS